MTKKPETRIKVVRGAGGGVFDYYFAQYKAKIFFSLIETWVDIRPTKTSLAFTTTLESAQWRVDDFLKRQETGQAEFKKARVEYIKYPQETVSNE